MKRKYRRACILLSLTGITIAGCSPDGGERAVETGGCPPAMEAKVAEKVDTLNIIIETSGSMGGFMPARGGSQTEFQQQVDELLANAESLEGKNIRTLRYYSARERMYKEVYSRFSQMLRRGLRNVGSSSPIPQMLENISNTLTGPDQVSIFISDFIYAPPNQRDRDFIANDIRRALGKVRQNNFVVSVFAAQSGFEGTYYPADSKSKPIPRCCKTEIPYYLWVIGPEEKVRFVNQEIVRNNSLEQVHFGMEKREPSFMIVPGSGREGTWYLTDEEGKTIQVDNSRDIQDGALTYTVGLQLNALPGQVAGTKYLEDNLVLDVQNGEGKITGIYNASEFEEQEEINNKDRRLLECFTHYVKISVDKVFSRNQDIEVNLKLQNKLPGWIDSYTTMNDSQIEEEGPKTFSLDAIMEGTERATGNQAKEFFNVTTTIDLSR